MSKPYPIKQHAVSKSKFNRTLLSSLIALNVAPALSHAAIDSSVWRDMPYHTRSYSDGTLGEQTSFFDADVLVPILGNNDWMGFVNGSGKYGDDHAWYGSLGGGIRAIKNNGLWGGYVFVDRNTSILNNQFWIVNPGLEWMNTRIDAHVNAYVPTSRRQSTGIFEGSFLGLDTAHIENRTFFDNIYDIMEVTGPGADAELGYTFHNLLNTRTFAGAYHFNLKESGRNITGVEGGFELPINDNLAIMVHDAYDSVQHNTIMGTIRLTLGGVPKTQAITDRMLDPIPRHLGAYQTGGGIPVVKVQKSIGRRALVENIWFFSPGGDTFNLANGFSNCTPANPCGTLSQDAINGINTLAPNANLFFAPGTYNNPTPATGFTLNAGQSLYGRGNFYLKPASSANRPIINDTVSLPGNNSINDLYIEGRTLVDNRQLGVHILPGTKDPVTINNSVISSQLNTPSPSDGPIGLYNQATGNTVNVNNSSVLVNVTNMNFTDQIAGIYNTGGTFNLANSTINVNVQDSAQRFIKGFINSPAGTANINQSVITVNTNNSGNFVNVFDNFNVASLQNSVLNLAINNSGAPIGGYGIDNSITAKLTLNNVKINLTATNAPSAYKLTGINSDYTSTSMAVINYKNTMITVNANSPATAVAVSTNAIYQNLGNVICTIIQDGVVSQVACP